MDKLKNSLGALERLKLKYEALRDIAVRSAKAENITEICQRAITNAVEIIDIKAGALTLYDSTGKQVESFAAGSEGFLPMMLDLEKRLISMLRTDFSVGCIFLTFNKDGTHSLFAYPLVIGDKNLGTISGVTSGSRNLSIEEEFIEAISSQLALAFLNLQSADNSSGGDIKKAKTEAIIETAVTLNHEIGNPLTAVLGNAQLLLVNRDSLDSKTLRMLEAIEAAALRIKEVTGRLLKIVEPAETEYTPGVKMVDIEKSSIDQEKE